MKKIPMWLQVAVVVVVLAAIMASAVLLSGCSFSNGPTKTQPVASEISTSPNVLLMISAATPSAVASVTPIPPHVGNAGLKVEGRNQQVATETPRLAAKERWSPGLIDQSGGGMAVAAILVVLAVLVVAGGRVFSTRRNI